MEYIKRENGYVYLIKEHDVYGNHKTITNLGKDPDNPMWAEDLKPKKKKDTKKEEDI